MASRLLQSNIDELRNKFSRGELAETDYARHAIIESWTRSRRNGLAFGDRAIFNPVARHQQKQLAETHRDFIRSAAGEMEALYAVLRDGRWAVSLLDAEGYIVKTVREAMPDFKGIAIALRPGVNLGEAAAGTTGPGCALADGKLAVVSGREHFLDEAGEFTCTAAPIHDPQARLIGVLNASRQFAGGRGGIPVPVMLTAQAIGNNLVRALGNAIVIDLHCPLDSGSSAPPGCLAFNPEGQVIGASQAARRLLDLAPGEAPNFAELFGETFGTVIDRLRSTRPQRIALTTHTGLRLFAAAATARTPRRLHALPAPAVNGPLPPEFGIALSKVQLAFDRDIPILLNGDTGTGKEVVARHLHTHGRRPKGPFVALNCSSIPASLIESELFGYDPGAFTGAARSGMAGKLEQANGGTLFLDEIGDMPVDLQARLLRVIQERQVCRIGGQQERPLDFALISATHRDLPQLIDGGLFREDLYYRINGLRLKLPTLKARSDFDRLLDRMLAEEAGGDPHLVLGEAARSLLRLHAWPGNLRELRQVIKLACAMAGDDGIIEPSHLPPEVVPLGDETPPSEANPLALAERDVFARKLTAHRGNISAVARDLGLARATVYKKLRDYRLI